MNKKCIAPGLVLAILATLNAWAVDTASPPPKPAKGSALLQLEDGRSGTGNLVATTGIRGFSKPASASAYALIMTIGDYQAGIPKLKGVPYDTATATEIATRMGVPAANIVALKDGALTLEGMRNALDAMQDRLNGNDQLFVYYSGHGGRQLVQEENGERCAESLITVDGQAMLDAELEQRLKKLSQKTQKTIVFLDACHSGGVTTRALGSTMPAYTAKSYTPPGQSCTQPSNILTRNIVLSKSPGTGAANFVHIAAARDSEVSLDQPGHGGVASQAWLACLAGAAKDTDGSGGLSAQEIQACAQDRIDKQLGSAQGFKPHHVTLTGNAAMVLSYAAKAPEPTAAASPPPATASAPAPAPAPAPLPAATPPAPVRPSALAALYDIYNSRDDRRLVTMAADKPQLKIGRDSVGFSITAREGGYLYLLMAGSDGKTFDLLFPNQIDSDNLLPPGATVRLPRPAWALSAEGPPGKNTLLAIVSETPRNFAGAGLRATGPFSSADAPAAKDIQLVTASSAGHAPECKDPAALRNLAIQRRCAAGYGAALLTLEEVQ